MGFREILVHLDNSDASAARLDLAVAYALKHGARLRGLYLITHSYYDSRDIDEQAKAECAEALFVQKTSQAGVTAEWTYKDWSVMGANVTDLITLQAYYCDLIIIGQTNFGAPNRNTPTDLPERLVLMCGRPVLIVPYAGTFETAGDRIMIAWKAGRESIRAVHDALPCLKKARHVEVVGIGAPSGVVDGTFSEIHSVLARHGVQTTTELINSGNFPVADMLLNNACEQKIDLLVMGTYVHTRRGSVDLSPIAKHILKHLTVPVLMSH